MMFRKIFIAILLLSADFTAVAFADSQNQFYNCSSEESLLIEKALQSALLSAKSWKEELAKEFDPNDLNMTNTESYQSKSMEQLAYEIIECSQRILVQRNLEFHCNQELGRNTDVRTFPLFGKKIMLGKGFLSNSESYIQGVIFHEVTHKCGTSDAAYFHYKKSPPQDTFISRWPFIADTYFYWIQYGFCIPQKNCK